MYPTLRTCRHPLRTHISTHLRRASTKAAATTQQKRAGDISDAFVSMSGGHAGPLPQKYAQIKEDLIRGHEDAVTASWHRLLRSLQEEIPKVEALGNKVIPEIDADDIDHPSEAFKEAYKETGVAVVRGVVPEQEALGWKEDLREYIRQNPHTKAFPANNPQVYELYFSRAQQLARTHPRLLATQRFLMSFWHAPATALVSTAHPTVYADRLRLRQPGDATFALGPHVDGGSVERWEPRGYGGAADGAVYAAVWRGRWEDLDPWDAASRLSIVSDLYAGVGACSMFRMAQGWMSLSHTGPGEGTLLVNPLLKRATAYYLLRPFFSAVAASPAEAGGEDAYLDPSNWHLTSPTTADIQGAWPGHGQELRDDLHPHLRLPRTMIPLPPVRPGDYVAWHCDTIHAVDPIHRGTGDSSVLYVPACPLTAANATYLARQRDALARGWPGPDFGGGNGEAGHVGRVGLAELGTLLAGNVEGARGLGLERWDWEAEKGEEEEGTREVMRRSNWILGFA